jgi:hypothetical protein
LTAAFYGYKIESDMTNKHNKSRKPEEIVSEINGLLNELLVSLGNGGNTPRTKFVATQVSKTDYSGPSGGLRLLVDDGFFNDSRSLPDVIDRLHQEGFKYPLEPIAVALLRMVRKRILVRLPSKNQNGKKIWTYAKRK